MKQSARTLMLAAPVLFTLLLPVETTAEVTFEQHEVVTGAAKHQTVLTGFFLGGAIAELVVVNVEENDDRRVRIYAFDGSTWVPRLDATLGRDVVFVDVANIGEHDRLVTYERGRVNWFDPDSATEWALVDVTTSYHATDKDTIPRIDITRDVNRDGRDDLLLPDVDGFWISIQLSDGSFTDAVKLGPPEPSLDEAGLDRSGSNRSRSYGEVGITDFTFPLYSSRVHEMDDNQDGRNDLVFWNEDHFDIHHQDARGLFDPVAKTAATDVAFDSDGVHTRMFDFSEEGAFSMLFGFNENTRRTVLHSLQDMNGDRIADLVTLTLAGRSPMRQRSLYQVHFGTPTSDGIVFARDAGTAIHPRGKAGGAQPWGYASRSFEDFDGDGQVDIMLRDVTIGFGGMIRALAANSIGINLEFYRMHDGSYPDQPNKTYRLRPGADFFRKRGPYLPAVLLGDLNGDGRKDLLAGRRKELHVYLGVPGPDLFEKKPQAVAVAMPRGGENARLVDLNKDGMRDILIHHPSTTDPHRVILLIAR